MTAPRPERPEDVRVEQHLGLANVLVRRYRVSGATGIDLDDLMQEAALGMLRARKTWDPTIASWSTYAAFWIKQNVGRYVQNHGATVRTPVFLQDRRLKRGESPRALVYSLDTPLGDEDGRSYVDMQASPEPEDDPDATPRTTLEELIASTPDLTDNEAFVLRERSRVSERTLKDIGADLGLSRERARQLEMSAIAKIREAQALDVDDNLSRAHQLLLAGRRRSARRARQGRRASGRTRAA